MKKKFCFKNLKNYQFCQIFWKIIIFCQNLKKHTSVEWCCLVSWHHMYGVEWCQMVSNWKLYPYMHLYSGSIRTYVVCVCTLCKSWMQGKLIFHIGILVVLRVWQFVSLSHIKLHSVVHWFSPISFSLTIFSWFVLLNQGKEKEVN